MVSPCSIFGRSAQIIPIRKPERPEMETVKRRRINNLPKETGIGWAVKDIIKLNNKVAPIEYVKKLTLRFLV
jgi:hypothetical protein